MAAGWVKKKKRGRERMMFLEAQRPNVLGLVGYSCSSPPAIANKCSSKTCFKSCIYSSGCLLCVDVLVGQHWAMPGLYHRLQLKMENNNN